MKLAIVKGDKREATRGVIGTCPVCGAELIARCGEQRINHWAHKGKRTCDIWWENETEWHRNWKNKFPLAWQEVVHHDKTGEKHIADVKTETSFVLEFQHSYINPEERRKRTEFYQRMAWVVDGSRRTNDEPGFIKVLKEGKVLRLNEIYIYWVDFPEESRILREWIECNVPVLFDFQEPERLWFLIPISSLELAYLIRINREYFIEISKTDVLEKLTDDLIFLINNYQKKVQDRREREDAIIINRAFNRLTRKKYRRRL